MAFASFDAVREKYSSYPDDDEQADTARILGAPESVTLAAEALDELLYKETFDARYRDAVKSKHEAVDFLDYPSVKAKLAAVEDALRKESKPSSADSDQPSAAGTSAVVAASATASENLDAAASAAAEDDFEKLCHDDRDSWRAFMLKTIHASVRFVADLGSAQQLEQAIKDNPFAVLKADPTGNILIHYDVKKSGEPGARPDLRVMPLREASYSRLVRALLDARRTGDPSAPGTLNPGDIALVMDGGRPGNKNKLLLPWKIGTSKEGAGKGKKEEEDGDGEGEDEAEGDDEDEEESKPGLATETLTVAYTEESLAVRRKRCRGTAALKQLEQCHIITPTVLKLPQRARKHYPGSTNGDLVQGVVLTKLQDEWQLPWQEKKRLYGKKNLIAVGGKTDGAAEGSKTVLGDRANNAPEPVCFWSLPPEWYDEVIHSFFAKLVLDLTPLDAKFALCALRNRVGYVGVAFNADHVKLMEDRLMSHLKKEMKDSASPLFNAAYAEAVGARVPATSSESPNPKAKAKPKPKPVPKPKPDPGDPNPKPKKKAKAKPAAKGEEPPPLVLDDDDDGQPQTEDGVDDD